MSAQAISVVVPERIKDLLWEVIPPTSKYDDPISLHNTYILAAFIRGKEEGAAKWKSLWRRFVDWCWEEGPDRINKQARINK
jgi:hypothetical protein